MQERVIFATGLLAQYSIQTNERTLERSNADAGQTTTEKRGDRDERYMYTYRVDDDPACLEVDTKVGCTRVFEEIPAIWRNLVGDTILWKIYHSYIAILDLSYRNSYNL